MKPSTSLELKISKFLRRGVLVAGGLIATGYVLKLRLTGDPFFNFQTYDRIPLQELLAFHRGRGDYAALISYAGLAALICLPLVRVLLTAVLFFRRREHLLGAVAAGVFLALLLAMGLGVDL
jgi:uncharacterized membrane protein